MSDLQSSTAAQSPLPDPETKEQTSGKADDGSDTEREDDRPAMFPALGSAQRIASPASTASTSTKAGSMLNASSLMPPPSFLKLPVTAGRPKKGKVALEPGFSPLDWAIHKTSVQAPKGAQLLPIPPSVLKLHNRKDDAWTAINGKVYNITPYLRYHPGGEKEIMRVAGRDGTKLFTLTHLWVNVEFMLDVYTVGLLIPEPRS